MSPRTVSPTLAISLMSLVLAATGTGLAATNMITGKQIKNGSITAKDLANGAITSKKLANGAVTSRKLKSGAVTSRKIGQGAVTADNLASNSVTAGALAPHAVTPGALAPHAVTAGALAPQAVTGQAIQPGAVSQNNLNFTICSSGVIVASGHPCPVVPPLPFASAVARNVALTQPLPGIFWTFQVPFDREGSSGSMVNWDHPGRLTATMQGIYTINVTATWAVGGTKRGLAVNRVIASGTSAGGKEHLRGEDLMVDEATTDESVTQAYTRSVCMRRDDYLEVEAGANSNVPLEVVAVAVGYAPESDSCIPGTAN